MIRERRQMRWNEDGIYEARGNGRQAGERERENRSEFEEGRRGERIKELVNQD